MKRLLLLTLVAGFVGSTALARMTYTSGHGQAMGYCSYNQGSFCIDRIRDSAESQGHRDAEWRCQANGGRSQTLSPNCSTSCVPGFLTPRDKNVVVRCSSSCTVNCDIRD